MLSFQKWIRAGCALVVLAFVTGCAGYAGVSKPTTTMSGQMTCPAGTKLVKRGGEDVLASGGVGAGLGAGTFGLGTRTWSGAGLGALAGAVIGAGSELLQQNLGDKAYKCVPAGERGG